MSTFAGDRLILTVVMCLLVAGLVCLAVSLILPHPVPLLLAVMVVGLLVVAFLLGWGRGYSACQDLEW